MTSNHTDSGFENHTLNEEYFITIECPDRCENGDAFKLSGQFKVPYEKNGIIVHGAQVLKHIILVVTRSGNYQAFVPFKDVIVFEDDVREVEGGCHAYFNVRVMDHLAFEGEGDYYVLCSLGSYLSNIIKITM